MFLYNFEKLIKWKLTLKYRTEKNRNKSSKMAKVELIFDPLNPLKLKRARDSESEDENQSEEELLNEDVGGNKRSRRVRKGIDTTQYQDDSSEEESDAEESKSKPNEEDSDSDMFASDEDEPSHTETSKKPKVQLLNIDELEKELEIDGKHQIEEIQSSGSSEDEKEDDSIGYYNDQESEHQDKTKSRKEPKLDAFNLKNEQSEGVFDADGNFIRVDKSDNEEEDQWLDEYKRKDIKLAKRAEDARNKLIQYKQTKTQSRTTEELLFNIIGLLQPTESPLEALQRLNKNKLKKKTKKYQPSEDDLAAEKNRQAQVIEITELAESLIDRGVKEVYEFEREELMIKYKQETGKQYTLPGNEQTQPQEEKKEAVKINDDNISKWEFRWLGDDQVHGSYTIQEIKYWKDNYFDNKVEIRKAGESNFKHIKDVHLFD